MELQTIPLIQEGVGELNQNAGLRAIIESGDVETLDLIVQAQGGGFDLSRFPGEVGWTPLAHSVLHQSKEVFRFLIHRGVDLQVPISVVTVLPHSGAGTRQTRNILSFCVMAQPSGVDYYEYANILCDEGVEIYTPEIDLALQPVWVLCERIVEMLTHLTMLHQFLDETDQSVIDSCKTAMALLSKMVLNEVRRGRSAGANFLMDIFCDPGVLPSSLRRKNLLAKAILRLMELGEDIDMELYDLSRFYFDNTTKILYDRVQSKQNERNLVFRSMAPPYNRSNSTFSLLPNDLRSSILERTVPQNLRPLERNACVRCSNTRNLHVVCENRHKLCGACYARMVQLRNFNCSTCGRRMLGT